MFFRIVGIISWTAICTLAGTVIGAVGTLMLLPEHAYKSIINRGAKKAVDKSMGW